MKLFFYTVILVIMSIGLPGTILAQGGGPSITLYNPLAGTDSVIGVINKIITGLQTVAIPIVAIMIFIGAFQILFAGGNPEKFKTGKKTILYTVIGYAIILIAGGITSIIEDLLTPVS